MRDDTDAPIAVVGSKAELDANRTAIKDIQPTTQDGPATILFADDTTLHVRRVIRAKDPPHMAGDPIDPVLLVAMEVHVALSASGLQFALARERDALDPFTFTITVGSRQIAVKPLDPPDVELCSHVSTKLLPRLRQAGGTELWVVTQYTVGESVAVSFKGEPTEFLALWQFVSLMEKMKLLGGGEMQTS